MQEQRNPMKTTSFTLGAMPCHFQHRDDLVKFLIFFLLVFK